MSDPVAARSKALERWGRGFESFSRNDYTSWYLFLVLSCVGRGVAIGQFRSSFLLRNRPEGSSGSSNRWN